MISELQAELLNDPENLGYAAYISSGNDIGLAELLNSKQGNGAATISLQYMTVGDFLLSIIPVIAALHLQTSEIKDKWDRFIRVLTAVSHIKVGDASVQYLLDETVSDSLWTLEQRNTVGKRIGSRAEILFGEDVVVSPAHISLALRGL